MDLPCWCPQLASKLNNAVESLGRPPLNIMVQVNTSGEECKGSIFAVLLLTMHFIHMGGPYCIDAWQSALG
jgi:uncharacterized pyridoxal phosphate-containing UPF0001 family protein